jgi:hypothetical protein
LSGDAHCGLRRVERLVPEALLDEIERELAPYLARRRRWRNEFTGFNTRRTGALLAESRGFVTWPRTHWCSAHRSRAR